MLEASGNHSVNSSGTWHARTLYPSSALRLKKQACLCSKKALLQITMIKTEGAQIPHEGPLEGRAHIHICICMYIHTYIHRIPKGDCLILRPWGLQSGTPPGREKRGLAEFGEGHGRRNFCASAQPISKRRRPATKAGSRAQARDV